MRKLARYETGPASILLPLGSLLDRYPQIELDGLAWRMDAAETVAPGTQADIPALVITLRGSLAGFANDYRAMLNYLESFQRDLAAQGYQVALKDKPLDVSPGGSISVRHETEASNPRFSMKLVRRPAT
jgi:hypothetical protein